MALFEETTTDTAAVTPTALAVVPYLVTATGALTLALTPLAPSWGVVTPTGVTVTPAASVFPRWGGVVTTGVSMTDTQTVAMRLADVLTENSVLSDPAVLAYALAVAQGMQVSEATAVVAGARLLELVTLPDATAPTVRYTAQVLAGLLLNDQLRSFFAADASDAISVTPATLTLQRLVHTTAETVTLSETLAQTLFLRVTAAETVSIADDEVLKAIYAGLLDETVEITAGHVQPSGAFTTWAVNTTTAAVTEYTNYAFNSFARLGRRYLGAGVDGGLYVLDGDDDDGTDIIAAIKTGLVQFGGSRFSTVQSVYLGMRGEGEFVLRVTDGDGVVRDYKVLAQPMRTARVNTGKGIRTRYLSFELISTGQDFDLDTIEMIPIVVQRRV